MKKGKIWHLGDYKLLSCGGELELRKNVHRWLKGGVSVRLYCITNNYRIYSRKRFFLAQHLQANSSST